MDKTSPGQVGDFQEMGKFSSDKHPVIHTLGEAPPHSVNLQNWGVSGTWPQILSGSAPLAFPAPTWAGNVVGRFGHGFWSHPTWARSPHANADAPSDTSINLKQSATISPIFFYCTLPFYANEPGEEAREWNIPSDIPMGQLIIKPPGNLQVVHAGHL